MKRLEKLVLTGCTKLENVDGLNRREGGKREERGERGEREEGLALEELFLGHCDSILRFESSKMLRELKVLMLTGCSNLAEVIGLEKLGKLSKLDLTFCPCLDQEYVVFPPNVLKQ